MYAWVTSWYPASSWTLPGTSSKDILTNRGGTCRPIGRILWRRHVAMGSVHNVYFKTATYDPA